MNNLPFHESAQPGDIATKPGLGASDELWKLLWDFDPNGLLVLDESMRITLVNPAMCQMLKADRGALPGRRAVELLGDVSDFQRAFVEQKEIVGQETTYPQYDLHVRKLIFPVPHAKVVAGIFVDLTREWKQRSELETLRARTAEEVRNVVDKQMRVAQEIAGLLGETTAKTKVSLLRLLDLVHPNHE